MFRILNDMFRIHIEDLDGFIFNWIRSLNHWWRNNYSSICIKTWQIKKIQQYNYTADIKI